VRIDICKRSARHDDPLGVMFAGGIVGSAWTVA